MNKAKLLSLLEDINQALDEHGGSISLDRVDNGTVFVKLSGGCQGCAGARMTLKNGVSRYLNDNLEGFEELIDITDHSLGENPYFTESD